MIVLVASIVGVLFLCSKRFNFSPKAKERIRRLKNKIFYNPLIRYSLLNTMSYNMIAMTAFANAHDEAKQVTLAVIILISINLLPLFYARLLYKRKAELGSEENKTKIGTLYIDRDLDDPSSKIEAR